MVVGKQQPHNKPVRLWISLTLRLSCVHGAVYSAYEESGVFFQPFQNQKHESKIVRNELKSVFICREVSCNHWHMSG